MKEFFSNPRHKVYFGLAIGCFIVVILWMIMNKINNSSMICPPMAERQEKKLSTAGVERTDYFYWMRERGTHRVMNHLKRENQCTDRYFEPVGHLKDTLYREIINRIVDEETIPYMYKNGFVYYFEYKPGKEHPVYFRIDESTGDKEILLDANERAGTGEYYNLNEMDISPDGSWLAVTEDFKGDNAYFLRIKNLKSGQWKDYTIENVSDFEWIDSDKIIYTRIHPETYRSYRVYLHQLDKPAEDKLLYEEPDERFDLSVYKSSDGTMYFVASTSSTSSEIFLLENDKDGYRLRSFQSRLVDLIYYVDYANELFWIMHNGDGKINFVLSTCQKENTHKDHWVDFLPYDPEHFLTSFELTDKFVLIEERINGQTAIEIVDQQTKERRILAFDDKAYTVYLTGNQTFKTEKFWVSYQSLNRMPIKYEVDLKTLEKKVIWQKKIKGNFNPDDYVTEIVMVPSHDSVNVPVLLMYKKGLNKDGSHPCLLEGYGAYGVSFDPYFSISRINLLERGFVYALAQVRGGGEKGRQWYLDGKWLKKKNTFKDFIAAAEFLVDSGYTSEGKLAIRGASAGGLLVGSVINMKPDLFRAAVAEVPFVDVLNTMSDPKLPLTVQEYEEWGNPEEKEFYRYIASYSPYDNVHAACYPAVYAQVSFNDSQVPYWEGAKWIAKLRLFNECGRNMLLRVEMQTGHAGKSGRYKQYESEAEIQTFLIKELTLLPY